MSAATRVRTRRLERHRRITTCRRRGRTRCQPARRYRLIAYQPPTVFDRLLRHPWAAWVQLWLVTDVYGVSLNRLLHALFILTGSVTQNPTPSANPSTTSGSITFGSNIATGALVLIGIQWSTGATLPSGVSDGLSNTYNRSTNGTSQTTDANVNRSAAWYVALNTTGGACTVTVTFAATTSFTIHAFEVGGRATASAEDTAGHTEHTTVDVTSSSNSITTGAAAGDDLFAIIGFGSSVSAQAAGSGYTLATAPSGSSRTEYRTNVAASTAFTGDFSWTSNSGYVTAQIALKASGGTTTNITVSVTSSPVVTLARGVAIPRTFTATPVVAFSRRVGIVRAITATPAVTLTRSALLRVAAAAAPLVAVVRSVQLRLNTTSSPTVSLTNIKVRLITIAITVATAVSVGRQVGLRTGASATPSVSVTRGVQLRIATTAAPLVTVTRGIGIRLTATAAAVASVTRGLQKFVTINVLATTLVTVALVVNRAAPAPPAVSGTLPKFVGDRLPGGIKWRRIQL